MEKEGKSWALKALTASTGREPEELLRDLYVEKRHSQQEIADALGVSRSVIAKWLDRFAISRDDRDQLEPLVTVQ